MNEHLGGSYTHTMDGNTYMPDVWEYLIQKYKLTSVADVGTGAGWNGRWFLDRGLRVIGIEGDPVPLAKNQLPSACLMTHDYTLGPLIILSTDLAWCSEFVEHVDEQFIPNYVATFKCCKYLCMTHGEPGQAGHHHVTLKDSLEWYKLLFDYGFQVDPEETLYLRSTDTYKAPWGRRTLCFFRNMDFDDHNTDTLAHPVSNGKTA